MSRAWLTSDAARQYIQYCNGGLIDKNLVQYVLVGDSATLVKLTRQPEPDTPRTYQRRFKDPLPEPPAANATNGSATANGWRAKVNGLVHSAAPIAPIL